MYQYRVVTHAGNIYVEYSDLDRKGHLWKKVQETYGIVYQISVDTVFYTIWGAKWWIRRQVKKDKKAAERKAEKAKDSVVVWGPYP